MAQGILHQVARQSIADHYRGGCCMTAPNRRSCAAKAKRIGCTLEVNKKHVTIWLAAGMQVAGNPGLNCLCNDAEDIADLWSLVALDLDELAMEPNEKEGDQ
jgi:hypothetical protein